MSKIKHRIGEQWDIKDTQTTYMIKSHIPGSTIVIDDLGDDDLKVRSNHYPC